MGFVVWFLVLFLVWVGLVADCLVFVIRFAFCMEIVVVLIYGCFGF